MYKLSLLQSENYVAPVGTIFGSKRVGLPIFHVRLHVHQTPSVNACVFQVDGYASTHYHHDHFWVAFYSLLLFTYWLIHAALSTTFV